MTTEVRIVGQGLAGSLLGWACERAGLAFTIEDRAVKRGASEADASLLSFPHESEICLTSTEVGAGIINPITGRRLVKSWRVDQLLPIAISTYSEIGDAVGKRLFFPYRLRRLFADSRERAAAAEKWQRGEFSDFGESVDDEGLWIAPAYRVDLQALVRALRVHWQRRGNWRDAASELRPSAVVVRCCGPAELSESVFNWVGLTPAKGELLEIEMESGRLDPAVILNRREWVMPLSSTRALVGATFEPGIDSVTPSARARERLLEAARRFFPGASLKVLAQRVGVRVVTRDKHPVIGRHPQEPLLGIFNGLGSKGALLAPWLAQCWVDHLSRGIPIDPAVDVARFYSRITNENEPAKTL